jgi:hypothetical protein
MVVEIGERGGVSAAPGRQWDEVVSLEATVAVACSLQEGCIQPAFSFIETFHILSNIHENHRGETQREKKLWR